MIFLGRFFAAIALGGFLTGCNRADLPPLKNGEGLRADCAILMNSFPEGEIPQSVWPRSVKELKATRVEREKMNIRIYVVEKRGNFRGGYCVFLDPQLAPSTQGVWIQKTEFKGIYQFRHY
jgi:hypothetical protein